MYVVMCSNNKYIKSGAVVSKYYKYWGISEEDYYKSREDDWYTADINKARVYPSVQSAKNSGNRGPLKYSLVEIEVIHKIK